MKNHITYTLTIQIEKNVFMVSAAGSTKTRSFQFNFAQKPKQEIFDLENKLRVFQSKAITL